MKVRKTLLVSAAGWAALAAQAFVRAQVPAVPAGAALPAGVGPAAAPLGIAPGPAAPGPVTFWQKLGLGKEQKEFCRRKLCETPIGQLINNSKAPLTALTGGLIPPFCPTTPTAAQLADPGAEGAAAAIAADEAGAKKRRAAVRYLGTVDCHYWPEAEDALVASLRGDRNECVRWEAAMALGSGCCCTKKTIEALTIVVSCSDRDGAPKETSYRVHAAAAAALDHCLACFCKVAAPETPPPPPPVEGTRPPIEGVTPPPPPPPPPAPVTAASAKPISPGEAKPAPGLNPPAPKDPPKRPVGPEYYARIAKAPLAAILAEARRAAEKQHSQPIVSDTPFATQGHTVAALLNYAAGPETQTVIPAGMTVPAGEMRAEVVSAKPTNLWDLLNQPEGGREVVVATHPAEAVVASPKPVVVKQEPKVVKRDPVRKPVTLPARQVVSAPAPMPKAPPMPAAMPKEGSMPAPTPAPTTVTMAEPKLDFPPPALPMPVGEPAGPSPYFATKGPGTTTVTKAAEPTAPGVSTYHPTAATPWKPTPAPEPMPGAPSPYFATKGTGSAKVEQPTAPDLSSYHATAATPAKAVPAAEPMPGAPSPYFATKGTGSAKVEEPTAPNLSSYHATAATPAKAVPAPEPMPGAPSPYFATKGTGSAKVEEPTAPDVSSYHATAATPAKPVPAAPPTTTSSPYHGWSAPIKGQPTPAPMSVPAPLPTATEMPSVPMKTRPVPPPAAPVVPAKMATPPADSAVVSHLLATAKGTGPVEVRKASIQELVKLKANTPEVMAALESLSDDKVPAVRTEATIAAARLKLWR